MACHVNILFPCPACVSGYRIIWHAILYVEILYMLRDVTNSGVRGLTNKEK